MSIITRLKASKRPNHTTLYFTDHKPISIPIELVFKHQLKKGKKISLQLIEELKNNKIFIKLYNKALNFLSYRPRSNQEVSQKLAKYTSATPELISAVIKKLQHQKYLDDHQFAAWFIDQRLTHKPKGPIALRYELIKKGVDKNIINTTLTEAFSDSQDTLKLAKKLAQKKLRSLTSYPYLKQKQKLVSFLSRRGFTYDTIASLVDELLPSE